MEHKGEYHDEQCPKCYEEGRDSSQDNMRVFHNTGLGYCTAGHDLIGKVCDIIATDAPHIKKTQEKQNFTFIEGEYTALPSRKISQKTCEFYGYKVNKNKKIHIAPYFDESGVLKMQQIRTKDKKFPVIGDKSYNNLLWGSWLFTPNDKLFCTITEGQIDCLSVFEAFGKDFPVLSLPNGAHNARNVIQKNMKYLLGFKYVVIAFDNDEAGKEATKECIKEFPPGCLRIAKWRRKDASDHLKEGEDEEIRRIIYRAVEYIPDPVLTGDKLLAELRGYSQKVQPWPWKMANMVISPIYTPAIYTIAALPGVGKTVVMADIMRSVIKQGKKIGVISLEESLPKLILKLSDMVFGTKLREVGNREFTEEEIEQVKPITESIVTFNHKEYGSNINVILENLPFIAKSLSCEFVIFDNLSFAATGSMEDERRNLDKAMLDLKSSSTKYGYTLFNICHLNDDNEDFRKSTMRGSRGMMMYSDQVIYLGRDTETQDKNVRNTLIFYVKKDREFGVDTGKSFELYYNPETKRFIND